MDMVIHTINKNYVRKLKVTTKRLKSHLRISTFLFWQTLLHPPDCKRQVAAIHRIYIPAEV